MADDSLLKAKKMLETLNDTLAVGPWNEGSFILMIGKKIRALRDDLVTQISKYEETELSSSEYLAHRAHLSASHKIVYVSLYSSEGVSIGSWEKIIANLPRQIVSRPVYATEEDVQNIIKTKEKKINEAYAVFYVEAAAILDLGADKSMVDKLGKPILVLKDNAIILENIEYFVHLSGKYQYSKGLLTKLE
jgi:intracellular multiplication protein IcmQ